MESTIIYERYMNAFLKVSKRMFSEVRSALEDELTLDQFQLVNYIGTRGDVTATELAEVFAVGKSSITAITTRLADRGILMRTRDEQDRRLVYLSLADVGKQLHRQARERITKVISTYMVHYDEEEIEGFIQTFEKLAHLMEKGSEDR